MSRIHNRLYSCYLSIFKGDSPPDFIITFIANQEFINLSARVGGNLAEPSFHIVERRDISAIVHYHYTMSTAVVARCDGPEPLLSCCIPLWNKDFDKLETFITFLKSSLL